MLVEIHNMLKINFSFLLEQQSEDLQKHSEKCYSIVFFFNMASFYGLYSSLHIYMLFNENQHHYEYNFIFLSISPWQAALETI